MAAAVPLFGVVVPGRPVMTNFTPVDATKCVGAEVIAPCEVSELTFFMLPSTPVPADHGAVLYCSADGAHWEVLGAVTAQRPSGTFRTGWPGRPDLLGCAALQLGVSLESLNTIENLNLMHGGLNFDRRKFAVNIARDLFEYMVSFSRGNSDNANIVVPASIFDRWLERFERKYRLDPEFMMKPHT